MVSQRTLEIYNLHERNKSHREIANLYGISIPRVNQIIRKAQRYLTLRETQRDDPLFQALDSGKIPTRLYNALRRNGYGREFDLGWLREHLQEDDFKLKGIADKGLSLLRDSFL